MSLAKVIVTNVGALEAKYGAGMVRVRKAVEDLVAADAARGIETRLVGLDRAQDLAPFGAAAVQGAGDEEGAKRAVDAIDAAARPHYYLLLGGPDIVPMQQLENYAGLVSNAAGTGDPDVNVPSDLPYACDVPFSRDPADFLYPSRVVGRLPDLLWAKTPAYLLELLRLAAEASPLPRSAYEDWLALSAASWRGSTELTVRKLFGDTSRLVLSPPQEDRWTAARLAPLLHFINCHGGNMDDGFNGEAPPGEDGERGEQVLALTARSLRDRVRPGTVVAAECCYGAQLFDSAKPAFPARGKPGIALEYLRQGACAVFGSSTVAYGPAEGNGHADVMCRHFVKKVLEGASIGRAALEARLAYIRSVKWVSPVMWKTISQFHLLGDPSVHPVAGSGAERNRRVSAEALRRQEAARRRHHRERALDEARDLARARQVLKDDIVPAEREQEFLARADKLGVRNKFVKGLTLLAGAELSAQGDDSLSATRRRNQVLVIFEAFRQERGRLRGRIPFPRIVLAVGHYRDGVLRNVERLESR